MGGQFPEGFGDVQHREVLEEVDKQMSLSVGRDNHDQGRVTPVHQAFDVDAVVRTKRLFCENDDGIAHAISLARRHRACMYVEPDVPWTLTPVRMEEWILPSSPVQSCCATRFPVPAHAWGRSSSPARVNR